MFCNYKDENGVLYTVNYICNAYAEEDKDKQCPMVQQCIKDTNEMYGYMETEDTKTDNN